MDSFALSQKPIYSTIYVNQYAYLVNPHLQIFSHRFGNPTVSISSVSRRWLDEKVFKPIDVLSFLAYPPRFHSLEDILFLHLCTFSDFQIISLLFNAGADENSLCVVEVWASSNQFLQYSSLIVFRSNPG